MRTLVVIVTLVCCYAACWGPTKNWGTQEVLLQKALQRASGLATAEAIAPLLIAVDVEEFNHDLLANGGVSFWVERHRYYYFWCFGYIAKLPYERYLPSRNF